MSLTPIDKHRDTVADLVGLVDCLTDRLHQRFNNAFERCAPNSEDDATLVLMQSIKRAARNAKAEVEALEAS